MVIAIPGDGGQEHGGQRLGSLEAHEIDGRRQARIEITGNVLECGDEQDRHFEGMQHFATGYHPHIHGHSGPQNAHEHDGACEDQAILGSDPRYQPGREQHAQRFNEDL